MASRKRPKTHRTVSRRDLKRYNRLGHGILSGFSYLRPQKRCDCQNSVRPCPFVACRYNLYLEVTEVGSIRFNYLCEPNEVDPKKSCILDIIDEKGKLTLEEVGSLFGITKERVRQIEAKAKVKAGFSEVARQLKEEYLEVA